MAAWDGRVSRTLHLNEEKMKDFRQLGMGQGLDPEDFEKIVPVMEALEKVFEPLRASIPTGADVWTGPEDCE
jgi:hypothetical protein